MEGNDTQDPQQLYKLRQPPTACECLFRDGNSQSGLYSTSLSNQDLSIINLWTGPYRSTSPRDGNNKRRYAMQLPLICSVLIDAIGFPVRTIPFCGHTRCEIESFRQGYPLEPGPVSLGFSQMALTHKHVSRPSISRNFQIRPVTSKTCV